MGLLVVFDCDFGLMSFNFLNATLSWIVDASHLLFAALRLVCIAFTVMFMSSAGLILSAGCLAARYIRVMIMQQETAPPINPLAFSEALWRRRASQSSSNGPDFGNLGRSHSADAALMDVDAPSQPPSPEASVLDLPDLNSKSSSRLSLDLHIKPRLRRIASSTSSMLKSCFKFASSDSLSRKGVSPASTPRTDPYQAPYFFPTPLSPQAVDYTQYLRKQHKLSIRPRSHSLSPRGSPPLHPSPLRKESWGEEGHTEAECERTSSIESLDLDAEDPTTASSSSSRPVKTRSGFKRLFRLSSESSTSLAGRAQPSAVESDETEQRKGPRRSSSSWSILRHKRTSSLRSKA